jgi:D-beta-D-heptose 7-phosphate kinase/D-beta-D-heptose 1-phosphate adenosyltransferase
MNPILSALSEPQVLVVGDIMLDEYIAGVCERINPEAPVPVVRVQRREIRLGGAANVAHNLAALGATPLLVGVVGEEAGLPDREVLHHLERAALKTEGLVGSPDRRTTRKTRIVAGHQHVVRFDEETTAPIGKEIEAQLINMLRRLLPECQAVVLSDYKKGVITDAVIREALALARARGVPTIVDPKGTDFSRYQGASMLTPNVQEARAAAGLPDGTDTDLPEVAARLLEQVRCESILITRGAFGMTLARPGQELVHRPTLARAVYDVVGAGDTALAAIALGLGSGLSMVDCMQLANVAAGVVVGKLGTSTVTRAEVAGNWPSLGASAKILSAEALVARVQAEKARGKRIVFTNGCFDVLHAGHVHLLAEARRHGDLLIVGLNSDDSVRRLKGPSRPRNPADARAAVLAALSDVDAVVLFEDDTPAALVAAICPDVLVKGADYAPESVVGREHAGTVVIIQLLASYSTTALLTGA